MQAIAVASLAFGGCGRFGFPAPREQSDASVDASSDAVVDTKGGPTQPVTFDTTSAGTVFCASSPCGYTHTVGAGSNGIIVIWYFCANSNTATTAVTVDGIAAKPAGVASYTNQRGELWYALTTAGAGHAISLAYTCPTAFVVSVSALNVDQVTPIRATRLDGTNLNTPLLTDAIQSSPNDLVLDGVCHGSDINPPSGTQIGRYLENLTNSYYCGNFAGSSQVGASPSVTMSWNSPINDSWAYLGLSLEPVGG
jgi:hypothetical protein